MSSDIRGAARRSTIIAAVIFVAAFAAYIAFRPDPTPRHRAPAIETTSTIAPAAATTG